MRAVSNTSPIYNLAAIDQLHLLRDPFERVFIPTAEEEASSSPKTFLRGGRGIELPKDLAPWRKPSSGRQSLSSVEEGSGLSQSAPSVEGGSGLSQSASSVEEAAGGSPSASSVD